MIGRRTLLTRALTGSAATAAAAANLLPSGGFAQTKTQTVNLHADSQKKMGIGVNASLDTTYKVTPAIGVALLLQYSGGKVDLDGAPGTAFGGFQGGLGLRLRF